MADEKRRDLQVVMARIGRTHQPPPIKLAGVDVSTEAGRDEAAAALYERCKRYLVSNDFTVTIDFTTSQVWIDGGRYGTGRLEAAP